MQRLKASLEQLDEMITTLEDRIGLSFRSNRDLIKKLDEQAKQSRAREAQLMAVSQKVAARLDQTIERVQNILGG